MYNCTQSRTNERHKKIERESRQKTKRGKNLISISNILMWIAIACKYQNRISKPQTNWEIIFSFYFVSFRFVFDLLLQQELFNFDLKEKIRFFFFCLSAPRYLFIALLKRNRFDEMYLLCSSSNAEIAFQAIFFFLFFFNYQLNMEMRCASDWAFNTS